MDGGSATDICPILGGLPPPGRDRTESEEVLVPKPEISALAASFNLTNR